MKGLFVKDWQLILLQKKMLLLILVLSVFLGMANSSTFVVSYLVFLCAIFSSSTLSYDEMQNGYTFLMTLPITRRKYVIEKYILGLGITLLGGILGIVVSIICATIKNESLDVHELILSEGLILIIAMLFVAVTIPSVLKFGQEKGRIVWLIMAGIIALIVYGAEKLCESNGIDMIREIDRFIDANLRAVYVLTLVVAAIGILVSYAISVYVLENKEL